MKSKIVAFTASLPLVTYGAMAFSSPAIAAVFGQGDLFSGDVSIRLGNLIPDSGIGIDFIFAPEVGTPLGEAPVGDLANFSVDTIGNTGAFAAFNTGGVNFLGDAVIRSFNVDTNAAQIAGLSLGTDEYFARIQIDAANSATGSAVDYLLSLDAERVLRSENEIIGTDALGRTLISSDFSALGLIQDLATGEITNVRYDFSIPSLAVESGSGTVADPFITDRVSQSATVRIEAANIPESSSVNTLIVMGSLGLIAGITNHSRNKNLGNKSS